MYGELSSCLLVLYILTPEINWRIPTTYERTENRLFCHGHIMLIDIRTYV